MKTIQFIKGVVLSTIFIAGSFSVSAQNSGVYKSFADYSVGKVEYGIDCAKEKHKIKLNDFWGKDFITVVHDGKSYDLKKAEIWGYQLCDEKIVRFQGVDDYAVGDKGVLWIYSKQTIVSSNNKSNSVKSETTYFFSKGGDGKIEKLTLLSLKSAFPDNHQLHDAIDEKFKTDASLGEFDEFHKHFKINHFLESQGIK